jgi:hypothetical protein
MLPLASGLVLVPFILSGVGDLAVGNENHAVNDYSVCVPWALEANLQTWSQVVDYYIEPPFFLPSQFDVLAPLPAADNVQPVMGPIAKAGPLNDEWASANRGARKVKQTAAGDWGSLNSQMIVPEGRQVFSWEDPLHKRQWQTDEAWKYTVLGPFSLYGQVNAVTGEVQQQDVQVAGKTGLACSVPTGIPAAALILRSGPSISYSDALRPDRLRERAEWLLEVEGRVPLIGGIGLEFQGAALPALNPLDHDRVMQDLRLAFPMGSTGKLKLGAKRQWETTPAARVLNDSTQLYLGLELTR